MPQRDYAKIFDYDDKKPINKIGQQLNINISKKICNNNKCFIVGNDKALTHVPKVGEMINGVKVHGGVTVSYTHLTLPTKRIV